ncbi:MAG: hypothetical protein KDJ72_08290 [Methyloceanibacter sp.]|uniref:hypothetical protein n=1 Tax=Methyloceanibacter sp. TaxID=1965321 RepID=UPI001D7FE377|nr:hypothetical protein [Methyloceanibacter sp.]MCB1443009.1 hypothetical protein [Methyloceanibacter sp.]MCC0058100.1 hypothetical protein [Hyphomicrobiaceae bacterium]
MVPRTDNVRRVDFGLCPSEFAKILGVSRPRVSQLLSQGRLDGAFDDYGCDAVCIYMRSAVERLKGTMNPMRRAEPWSAVDARMDAAEREWEARCGSGEDV